MRKTGLILLLGLTIISCSEPNVDRKYTGIRYGDGAEVEEIVIDGCQYIGQFGGFNTDWGTHKGNCNNPIHKQTKVTVVDTVEYKLIRE